MNAPLPDLSQDDRRVIFNSLDLNLNHMILDALLYSLYTGIIVVTLWNIFSSPKRLHSTFLHTIIIMLYALSTIGFVVDWVFNHHAFIKYSNSYYSVFIALQGFSPWWKACNLVNSVTGGISTLLVDITIIWRCWTLWDRQWRVSVLFFGYNSHCISAMKVMQILSAFHNTTQDSDISKTGVFAVDIDWTLIYLSLALVTTIMCTLLIVYRIIRHSPGISTFHQTIEMIIESSAMYSLALVVYLALVSKNSEYSYYADIITVYVKAIAPTFLMLRVVVKSMSSSSDQELTDSQPLSDINFRLMGENMSSFNLSHRDQSLSGTHGTCTTESV
ncbi:hypothetical protein ARMSODRAFT_1024715 [Armillaria solidipes]|uniref:Uncharacterized protein n=1 Tax=Armillaria solidipes TaxID=1076256 RepID=A0A2H3B0R8_9AGAR|nr:hypothetical protein ARMSODRAFT_1024715 [Armillaria solidipes]